MNNSRSLFTICRYQGQPIGCGALRPLNETTAELKRMYSRKNGIGVCSKILNYLEQEAINLNYSIIRLETRKINKKAIQFYESKGYMLFLTTEGILSGLMPFVLKKICY